MVLMCSDLRRLMLMVFAFMSKRNFSFSLHSSSLRQGLCTPAYGGFFEFDLQKEKKISLRTLVSLGSYFIFPVVHFAHFVSELNMNNVSCRLIRQRWRALTVSRVCIMARVYPLAVVNSGAHTCAFNNGSTTIRARKHGKEAAHFLDL